MSICMWVRACVARACRSPGEEDRYVFTYEYRYRYRCILVFTCVRASRARATPPVRVPDMYIDVYSYRYRYIFPVCVRA